MLLARVTIYLKTASVLKVFYPICITIIGPFKKRPTLAFNDSFVVSRTYTWDVGLEVRQDHAGVVPGRKTERDRE